MAALRFSPPTGSGSGETPPPPGQRLGAAVGTQPGQAPEAPGSASGRGTGCDRGAATQGLARPKLCVT